MRQLFIESARATCHVSLPSITPVRQQLSERVSPASPRGLDVPQTIMITSEFLLGFDSTTAGTRQLSVAQRTRLKLVTFFFCPSFFLC